MPQTHYVHTMGTKPQRPLEAGDVIVMPSGERRKVYKAGKSVLFTGGSKFLHRGPVEGDFSGVVTEVA